MPSYTPGLVWPRSDGTPSTWPTAEEQRPSNVENWFEKLSRPHEKYDLYEQKLGKHIADKLGINAASYRMPLPEGYALFAHHKPQSTNGTERIDVYLRGCPSIGKRQFRSTNEFLAHADWLFDTLKRIDDHEACGCIYNNKSALAQQKKAGNASSSLSSPSKRPLSGSGFPTKSTKRAKADSSDDEDARTGIIPERAADMKTNRRFRKGELVWFRVDNIIPPTNDRGLPAITHWPALVAGVVVKTRVEETTVLGNGTVASAALTTAWSMAGGVTPATLRATPQKITYVIDYHIRPLGFFSTHQDLNRKTQDLLPWALGNELLGGLKGWSLIGSEGTRIIKAGVVAELSNDRAKGVEPPSDDAGVEERWRTKWAQRWSFTDMPRAWDTSVFRLGIALKIAAAITNGWTQTDKIDVLPGADVNPEDLAAIEAQKKTLYQGLWWGGERIWLEDMVRLKKNRGDLPVEALGEPSPGAIDRAVFLRIRMITIEVSPDATEDKHAWRCLLYGDAFELSNAENSPAQPTLTIKTDEGEPITYHHPVVKGYAYKQLNDQSSEVTADIMDVAGRVYPDLLEPSTQNWFRDQSIDSDANAQRVTPGDAALALVGLKPGSVVGSKSDKWKEDLFMMVTEGNKVVERSLRKYYGTLLNPMSGKKTGKSPMTNHPVNGA